MPLDDCSFVDKVAGMIRFFLAALLTSFLPLGSALAQSEELNAAIDAYLQEDYSHVDVIARHAEEGVPEAIAILGQAYLYGYGIEANHLLGVALLEQAASLGQRSSTVRLGRVFEFGVEGIPVDEEIAAKWYVEAARAGDTRSAPAALKRLPRDVVIAAGGTAWARKADTAGTLAETETAAETLPVAPSPAGVLLGTSTAPLPLRMNDGTSFPLLADTRLSAIGDAAASCFVILKPEIDRQKLALEGLMKLDGFGASQASGSRHAELAETDRRIAALSEALRASEAVLGDPKRNGGLNPEDVRLALIPHAEAQQKRPETGPGASLCANRLVSIIGESAAWPATRSGTP